MAWASKVTSHELAWKAWPEPFFSYLPCSVMQRYGQRFWENNCIYVETDFPTVPVNTACTKQTQILPDSHTQNTNSSDTGSSWSNSKGCNGVFLLAVWLSLSLCTFLSVYQFEDLPFFSLIGTFIPLSPCHKRPASCYTFMLSFIYLKFQLGFPLLTSLSPMQLTLIKGACTLHLSVHTEELWEA